MQDAITTFRSALDAAPAPDLQTRNQLLELGLEIVKKTGEPYVYGLPGSDPNIEQLSDGQIVVTLIYPIRSGAENIESIRIRLPTIGDRKDLPEDGERRVLEKLRRTGVVHTTNRQLTMPELEKLAEEDFLGLTGALAFFQERFRRTGRTFKTS
jgi:hypothetical protein